MKEFQNFRRTMKDKQIDHCLISRLDCLVKYVWEGDKREQMNYKRVFKNVINDSSTN